MHELQTNERTWSDFLTDTSQNVNNPERVASAVAGGALLAYGIKHGGMAGSLMSLLGGGLLLRGATGHCQVYDAAGIDTAEAASPSRSPYKGSWLTGRIHVTRSVTINKSPAELYGFWRNFENLPKFMKHLESVTKIDETRSHWKAAAPMGYSVEWDAEITSERLNERIGWKSVEGSDIANSGVVEFKPTINRGTEVRVSLTYAAPGGKLGEMVAKLFGEEPGQQVSEDLRRFKCLMETGIIITTEGQPSGREPLPKSMAAKR
jgi:uncharacterized membrane protein